MDDLRVPKRPDVGVATALFDAAVPPGRSEAMNRDEAVTGPDYPLQLDSELSVGFQPGSRRSNDAFVATIGLASMVGQDVVFKDHLRVEKRKVCLTAAAPPLANGSEPFQRSAQKYALT